MRQVPRGGGPPLTYEIVGPATPSGLPTLVCLHGMSSHRGIWRPVARHLPSLQCILVDLRGHGDSERAGRPAYDPSDHAADIARLVTTLGLGSYAIAGHSAGALAATRFIATLRSGDPVPPPVAFIWVDLDPLVPSWQVAYFHERAASVGRVLPSIEDAVSAFQRMYPRAPDRELRAFVTEGLGPVAGGWQMKLDPATYATWEPGDVRPELPRVSCPTLVLRGADSVVSSQEGLAALRAGLPHCEIREVAGTSHLVLLEEPARVAEEILTFLTRHAGSVGE